MGSNSNVTLAAHYATIGQVRAHENTSSKYGFISTERVLKVIKLDHLEWISNDLNYGTISRRIELYVDDLPRLKTWIKITDVGEENLYFCAPSTSGEMCFFFCKVRP